MEFTKPMLTTPNRRGNLIPGFGSLTTYPLSRHELELLGGVFGYPSLHRQIQPSIPQIRMRSLFEPIPTFWDAFDVLLSIVAKDLPVFIDNAIERADEFCELLYQLEETPMVWQKNGFEFTLEQAVRDSKIDRCCLRVFLKMFDALELEICYPCATLKVLSHRPVH